jgi:hypothetical protein
MPYLTIKQAAQATGKSEKTIRRLCNLSKSKDYVTYEDTKLLVDANYLQQNYPMISTGQPVHPTQKAHRQEVDMTTQNHLNNVQPQQSQDLSHEIELLKLQLKHKEEIIYMKDRQLEVLERSLLLLGEGLRKEPVTNQEQPEQISQEQEPAKKKSWWHWRK